MGVGLPVVDTHGRGRHRRLEQLYCQPSLSRDAAAETRRWQPCPDCAAGPINTSGCATTGWSPARRCPLVLYPDCKQLQGNLFNTNFSSVANLSTGHIAYVSCSPEDDAGFAEPQKVFDETIKHGDLSGVILYSTTSDYCSYEQNNNQESIQGFPILSMTSKTDSVALRAAISNLPMSSTYPVQVQGRGDANNNNNNSNNGAFQQQNPLGPSPSTAVAMIILYSITGIITALFLVIIITGAVRAHRHPERYGPRDVLGRPRQSRARGLGRAILDTLPIVKFGEKEPAKVADVELGSKAETKETGEATVGDAAQATQQAPVVEPTDATSLNLDNSPPVPQIPRDAEAPSFDEHQEGIAPAQCPAVGPAVGASNTFHEENLGCSICTEDFETGQDLRVLPCDHKFHPECVDPWLLNVSGTCPLW